MNKRFLIGLLLTVIPFAHASDISSISQALDVIDSDFKSSDSLRMIIGVDDDAAYLKLYNNILMDNIGPANFSIGEDRSLSLVNDDIPPDKFSNRHIIIAGGPCANKYWNTFSDETCEKWPYKSGQSVVKVMQNGDHLVLLVAGTTQGDTFEIASTLSDYRSNGLFSDGLTYVLNSEANRTVQMSELCSQTDDCSKNPEPCRVVLATPTISVDYEFDFEEGTHTIKAENLDFTKDTVDLTVDRKTYGGIRIGELITVGQNLTVAVCGFTSSLSDRLKLAFSEPYVFPQRPSGVQGLLKLPNRATLQLGEDNVILTPKGQIKLNKLVIESQGLVKEITIDSKRYTGLKVGDSLVSDKGIKMTVVFAEDTWVSFNCE
jgi:hypothetical protein